MKPLFRPFAWILTLLLLPFGCHDTDEPAALPSAKDAVWQKLESARPETPAAAGDALTVEVIDVGQGDSILLVSPEGRTMLVDAGPSDAFGRVEDALKENGVTALDVVVATHPHEDHIGSMAAILDAYPVGAFYTIAEELPTGSFVAMRAALERNGCPVYEAESGMTIHWADSCNVTVLGPVRSYDPPEDLNDLSVVLHVRYGETAVLLAGDAEEIAEGRMLDAFPASMLRADVLKLGHHGSSSSTGYAFFLAVDPDFAVASCGKDNDYGHPHYQTLSLLYDTHTAFYRTDCDGSVTFRLNGETVSVERSRKETP